MMAYRGGAHYSLHVCSLVIEATCSGPLGTWRQYKQAILTDTSWWLIGELLHYSLHVCSLAIEATCSGPLGTWKQYKQAILTDTSCWLIGEVPTTVYMCAVLSSKLHALALFVPGGNINRLFLRTSWRRVGKLRYSSTVLKVGTR
jgi:hypothetical protein